MLTNHDRAALAVLWDALIPGTTEWPKASAAIAAPEAVDLSEADRVWLAGEAIRLSDLPDAARVAALVALERDEPERFARVLHALYDAYYTSPLAHAVVRRLAESGPRERDPLFDATQLDQVIATQAGLRRAIG